MSNRIMILALVLIFTGCTHTRNAGFIGEESYTEINRLGARREATVTLSVEPYMRVVGGKSTVMDQRDIQVSNLQITLDSTSWLNRRTGRFETVATARIREVRIAKVKTNHGRGARQGLGIGLLIGAAFGAILGFASGDDPPCVPKGGWLDLCWSFTAGDKARVGAIGLGAVGGLLGLLTGAAAGSKEIDRFEAPTNAPPVADGEHRRE